MTNGTIDEILNEAIENDIEIVDITKYKFKHSEFSKIEPMMKESDYSKLRYDIKLRNGLNYPVVIYKDEILDGRNRQRACIELELPLRVIELKGEYSPSVLSEYVRSIHMSRSKNLVQNQIQAYRFKKTVAGVTWETAAEKYGVTVISVKRVNTFYNTLNSFGLATQFDVIIDRLFMGLNVLPSTYEWVTSSTCSVYTLNKQLKEYMAAVAKEAEKNDIDTTEIDPKTGETLTKDENYYMRHSQTLEEKVSHLESKLEEALEIIKKKDRQIDILIARIEVLERNQKIDYREWLLGNGYSALELENLSEDELKEMYEEEN